MTRIHVSSILLGLALLTSCGTAHHVTSGTEGKFIKKWNTSGFSEKHHVGLAIYDPVAKKFLVNYRSDNYFTTASNTKILTLYAALQTLGDSIEAAKYIETKDSLLIWGGGDPGTLYPDKNNASPLINFINHAEKSIVFSQNHFKAKRFGHGWAWDDYSYNFQCERNAFPAYGNRIWIERYGDSIVITPKYLSAAIDINKASLSTFGKTEWGDEYYYTYPSTPDTEELKIPITFFENDTRYTWAEITGKNIHYSNAPLTREAKSIMGSPRDTLLKIMMQESDNFIAEQLLLSCSLKESGYMSDIDFIQKFKSSYFFNLPDEPRWYDGSGLSRYNAMTPASIIDVLNRIYQLKGMAYIKTIFPVGGVSGTIEDFLISPSGQPFVYAKSGSLSKVYCLSGYLITQSGKVLLFSWLNNQIAGTADEVKAEIEKYLLFVYTHY